MNFLSLLVLLISSLTWGAELQLPALTSPVMDQANFLNDQEKQDLASFAYEINTNNGPQITILTVQDMQGYPIEEFSIRVAEKWQLGTSEKDNGLLIVIAKDERQMRIEVGNGIEGEITDYDTAKYTKEIFPKYFKRGEFHAALRLFMDDVASKFNIKIEGTQTRYVRRTQPIAPKINLGIIIISIFVLLIIGSIFQKKPGLRGLFSGASVSAIAAFMGLPVALIVILFVIGSAVGVIGMINILSALASSHGGRYGGGGYSGGGGGGWSGGGGGFSGGGSSGSW